jgi:peptidoglycan/xylan/chitin deacetylase (PgdA/CDA1 family)
MPRVLTSSSVKRQVQRAIRAVHLRLLQKPLPEQVAIYCHSLEAREQGQLEELVLFFKENGYAFCHPDEFLEGGARKVMLSFDDNYRSWYEALDLLEQLQVRVTFFTNTMPIRDSATAAEITDYFDRLGHAGDRVPLSEAELKALEAAGHVIGSHTHSHHMLTGLPHEHALEEIRRGKESLEGILGHDVDHFSYPFGLRRHFNEELRSYCERIGFKTVSNAIPATQYRGHTAFNIQRSVWHFDRSLEHNSQNLCVDGQWFERLTGRSAVG